MSEQRETAITERRAVAIAALMTLLVHAALGLAITFVDEQEIPVLDYAGLAPPEEPPLLLCDENRRCPSMPWPQPRMGLETPDLVDLDIIEAAIIPRLGLAEDDSRKLPEIQKYEQPEVVEEAIQISPDPPPEKRPPPLQAPKPRPPERDRRRRSPRDLSSILGPRDDDPRARATSLERIIGREDGSPGGMGAEWGPGNEWAGQVTVALRREFAVPSSISDSTLRRLSVQILIQRINRHGEIQRFEIQQRSGNSAYDTAAIQLIKMFMPDEGGTERLPEPPRQVLDFVNQRGLLVELEGRLFRR